MDKKFNEETNTNEKKTMADKVGGLVEKAGHKIAEAGATKLGQKVHDLGDKMEKNHSNPSHPHKT